MAAIPQVRKTGPRTYIPAELITGGQVVEARAASRVGVAAAASLKVLGVAVTDGINPEAFVSTPVVVNGLPVVDATQHVESVQKLLSKATPAVLVRRAGTIEGIVTRSDMLAYLMAR